MNKSDIINELKERTDIPKLVSKKIVDTFFDSITDSLVQDDRVEIRGFCSFFIKEYKSYTGRNPKTGEKISVESKRLPFFKCGKELKERTNS